MIGDVTATQGGAVGVPGWVGCEARRMRGLQSQLSQEQGRAVTPDDVAHYLGARRGRVVRLLSCTAPDALLDADGHVRDPAATQSSEHPLADEVAGLVASLPDRERAVVELRFGFGGGESHSQAEAAKRLRMSESTVRRLERGALAVLRRAALKLQAA
ncbi:MAG: helix-turn-helix domain-containing protein [Micropruina sp.]|nr:helix-turn-helix domain-containing protein [Micropruina sp.]